MTNSIDLITEFEKTFSVEKWEVNGLNIWPAIRIPLMTSWEQKIYYQNGEFSNNNLRFFQRVSNEFNLLKLALSCHSLFPNNRQYKIGVWGLDCERILADNKYYSPYGDALNDLEFEGGNSVLCVDSTIERKRKNHYPNIDVSLSCILNRYISKVKSLLTLNKTNSLPLIEARKWCESRNLPSTGLTNKSVLYQFYLINALKKKFVKIIIKHKMEFCLKVSWYDHIGMALAWAAKDAGILCFDLQHGIAGASRGRAYSTWSRIPSKGFEIMPDGFWCWTDKDAAAIMKWSGLLQTPLKIFIGGNIWQRLWIENKYPKKFFENIEEQDIFLNTKGIKILYTLQTSDVTDLLFSLIKKSPKEWNWWIRCHPMYLDSFYSISQKLKSFNNVDVFNATNIPLPRVLKSIDIHITGWSAVIYDAKYFGVKSIVCHPSSNIFFKDAIDDGDITYMSNEDEIIDEINSNIDKYTSTASEKKYPSFLSYIEK